MRQLDRNGLKSVIYLLLFKKNMSSLATDVSKLTVHETEAPKPEVDAKPKVRRSSRLRRLTEAANLVISAKPEVDATPKSEEDAKSEEEQTAEEDAKPKVEETDVPISPPKIGGRGCEAKT